MDPDSAVETELTSPRSRGGGARRLDRRSLEILRSAALAHMGAGAEVREIASSLGMSRSTVYRWRALAQRAGAQSAAPPPEQVPSPQETPAYYGPLYDRLTAGPRAAGFDTGLWSKDMVRTTLAGDFGVRATAAQVQRILHRLGVWPRKPLPRHHELADDEWLESVLPRIEAKAATENATLCFVQDVLVRDGTMWMMSAVTTRGVRRFALYDRSSPASSPPGPSPYGDDHLRFLGDFLDRLTEGASAPVYVVLEPLPAAGADVVERQARSSNGLLRVFYLPDVLARLERYAEQWRRALAATKRDARARDRAAQEFQSAKAAEERMRVLRDEAIGLCRAAGVPIAAVVRHTGLAPKTVYDALGRPLPDFRPGDPELSLARLDEATGRWRDAVAATREQARARERATRAYRDTKAVEERLRAVRDGAIIAWRATGIQPGVLASRTRLSGGLISQITGRSQPRNGDGRRGMAGNLLSELEQVSERWRQAATTARDQARARDEAARAYREGKASEERLRLLRDKVITDCRAAGVPVAELASYTGLDISTIYGLCHAAES